MAKHRAKSDLPRKTCTVCQRPFVWRKKWSKVWDQVLYCSDACRRHRNANARTPEKTGQEADGIDS